MTDGSFPVVFHGKMIGRGVYLEGGMARITLFSVRGEYQSMSKYPVDSTTLDISIEEKDK